MLKKYFNMLAILMAMVLVVSCSDDDNGNEPSKSENQMLIDYIESTTDYINTNAPAIKSAEAVYQAMTADKVHIVDIRAKEDYDKGHIEDAVHVPLSDLLTHVEGLDLANDVFIAIVCYSGQSAAYGTGLLRLMGHDNVYSMKFGMSSWSEETIGPWQGNVGNTYASQFVTEETEKPEKSALPNISTGESTGAEILRARVEQAFAEGFGPAKVSNSEVFGDLDGYQIVNYWPENLYLDPGHIPGAMQYTPKEDLAFDTDLLTLSNDKPIAVYCFTGQTSANVTAFLRVLGYDAKSLLFGTNGMIYGIASSRDDLHAWSDAANMGYDIVK